MQALRHWTLSKVLLAAIALFLLSLAAMVCWVFMQASGLLQVSGGSGIGAVSIGFSDAMLVMVVVPPFALVAAWLVARALRS